MCHLHMLSNSAIKVGVQAAPVKDAGRVKFGLQALVNGIKRACPWRKCVKIGICPRPV